LVTGDIAFLYDSKAFWSELRPHNLRIVVINNRGGGIFRIIDGPSTSAALAPYFETTHERSAGEVAGMYRLPFRQVADGAGLRAGLDWLYNREECSVLEICTPREENDRILKDYFRELKKYQP
ncbi:MAG: 2-succinyl-5-enolpyruvyl-6-hydroxy-3-cyclohexene-1-carboxylate synthase, partial [Bacteroidota bacterium]